MAHPGDALLNFLQATMVAKKPARARPSEGGRPTPEKENGPAYVLRAAANAAVMRRGGALAYAEVNQRPQPAQPASRRGLRQPAAARV